MAKLRPAFDKEGSVTAGNASGINDGAGVLLLASETAVKEKGLKPMASILAWGHAGVEPSSMGIGPDKAVPIAPNRAELRISAITIIVNKRTIDNQAYDTATEL